MPGLDILLDPESIPMQTKEFGAKIPQELYDEFRDLFPMYGATTYFIETALREFIKQVRDNPSAQQHVVAAIEEMLQSRRDEVKEEA